MACKTSTHWPSGYGRELGNPGIQELINKKLARTAQAGHSGISAMMAAAQLAQIGQPLAEREACGGCGTDLHAVNGDWTSAAAAAPSSGRA